MKKKESGIMRHPHFPQIIKLAKSVKTTSTMSTCNQDEDLCNAEKLSFYDGAGGLDELSSLKKERCSPVND